MDGDGVVAEEEEEAFSHHHLDVSKIQWTTIIRWIYPPYCVSTPRMDPKNLASWEPTMGIIDFP